MTKRVIQIVVAVYVAQACLGIGAGLFAAWTTPEGKQALATLSHLIKGE